MRPHQRPEVGARVGVAVHHQDGVALDPGAYVAEPAGRAQGLGLDHGEHLEPGPGVTPEMADHALRQVPEREDRAPGAEEHEAVQQVLEQGPPAHGCQDLGRVAE